MPMDGRCARTPRDTNREAQLVQSFESIPWAQEALDLLAYDQYEIAVPLENAGTCLESFVRLIEERKINLFTPPLIRYDLCTLDATTRNLFSRWRVSPPFPPHTHTPKCVTDSAPYRRRLACIAVFPPMHL